MAIEALQRRLIRFLSVAKGDTFLETTQVTFPGNDPGDIDKEKKAPWSRLEGRALRISTPVRRFFFGIRWRVSRDPYGGDEGGALGHLV